MDRVEDCSIEHAVWPTIDGCILICLFETMFGDERIRKGIDCTVPSLTDSFHRVAPKLTQFKTVDQTSLWIASAQRYVGRGLYENRPSGPGPYGRRHQPVRDQRPAG